MLCNDSYVNAQIRQTVTVKRAFSCKKLLNLYHGYKNVIGETPNDVIFDKGHYRK